MAHVLNRLAEALGVDRRVVMVGVGVFGVLLIWGIAAWASGPAWVALLSGVPMETIGSVTRSLDEAGVEYRLAAGGSAVEVPEGEAARARVALAEQGIPAGGAPGFELFDEPAWGMTDFTQKVNYRRALEGELARTVSEMQGVERARVHLTLRRATFLDDGGEPAEASVVVALRGGARPDDGMVEGIAFLVASAVEGLVPERVTVLDDAGRTLSAPTADGSGLGLSSRQIDVRREVETYLESKAQKILERLIGPGNASVRVAASLNFDRIDRTVQSVSPGDQVAIEEDRSEIIPGNEEQGASKVETRSVYETSRRLETLVSGGAKVERLSVSVLVASNASDGGGAADAAAAGGTATAGAAQGSSVPAVDAERIEALVANAVGLVPERGDRIAVVTAPLAAPAVPPVAPEGGGPGILPLLETLRRPLLGVVGAALAFFLAMRLLRELRAAPATPTREEQEALEGSDDAEALPERKESIGQRAVAALQGAQAKQADIDMADPQLAARVVRAWMNEE